LYEQRQNVFLLFSETSASFFLRVSRACSSNYLESDSERKSISTERTFSEISKPSELMLKLEELCQALVEDVEAESIQGKTVTLKIKTTEFKLNTRSKSTTHAVSDFRSIFKVASDLLENEIKSAKGNLPLRCRTFKAWTSWVRRRRSDQYKQVFSVQTKRRQYSCWKIWWIWKSRRSMLFDK